MKIHAMVKANKWILMASYHSWKNPFMTCQLTFNTMMKYTLPVHWPKKQKCSTPLTKVPDSHTKAEFSEQDIILDEMNMLLPNVLNEMKEEWPFINAVKSSSNGE